MASEKAVVELAEMGGAAEDRGCGGGRSEPRGRDVLDEAPLKQVEDGAEAVLLAGIAGLGGVQLVGVGIRLLAAVFVQELLQAQTRPEQLWGVPV